MSDTPWTPGPLTVRRAAKFSDCGIVSDGKYIVAEVFSDIRHANENAIAEAMANATLYAAAPDLFYALAEFVAIDDDEDATPQARIDAAWAAACAALAKARGQL